MSRNNPEFLIVHCSDTEGPEIAVDAWKAFHRYHTTVNGWSDIGYHFTIGRDGTIIRGRSETTPGAHCKGYNKRSLGICLVGQNTFTREQLQSLGKLGAWLMYVYPPTANPGNVLGHCDTHSGRAAGKTCPNIDTGTIRALMNTAVLPDSDSFIKPRPI